MSAMSALAEHLAEFGGELHTRGGWLARRADGSIAWDEPGYRYARWSPCAGCSDCPECGGWFTYVGRAFASEDAATVLAEIVDF